MCILCIAQVTLMVKILAYAYLFQIGCMAMSIVIGYYCSYWMALILQLDLNLHFKPILR